MSTSPASRESIQTRYGAKVVLTNDCYPTSSSHGHLTVDYDLLYAQRNVGEGGTVTWSAGGTSAGKGEYAFAGAGSRGGRILEFSGFDDGEEPLLAAVFRQGDGTYQLNIALKDPENADRLTLRCIHANTFSMRRLPRVTDPNLMSPRDDLGFTSWLDCRSGRAMDDDLYHIEFTDTGSDQKRTFRLHEPSHVNVQRKVGSTGPTAWALGRPGLPGDRYARRILAFVSDDGDRF